MTALVSSGQLSAQPMMEIASGGGTICEMQASTGYLSFAADGATRERLSFREKSFFYLKMGDKVYTNHDQPPAGMEYLRGATLQMVADTLSATWTIGAARITQVAYPTMTAQGELIVVRFYANNLSSSDLSLGMRFLLDVQVIDDAPGTLRAGVGKVNASFIAKDPVPSHLLFSQNVLPNAPSYYPGITAALIADDPFTTTLQPSMLLFDEWPSLEKLTYDSDSLSTKMFGNDGGVMMEWPDRKISASKTVEFGSFIYGKNEINSCHGILQAISLPPRTIVRGDSELTSIDIPVYLLSTEQTVDGVILTATSEGGIHFGEGEQKREWDVGSVTRSQGSFIAIPIFIDSPQLSRARITLTIRSTKTLLWFVDECSFTFDVLDDIEDRTPPAIRNITASRETFGCSTRLDTLTITDQEHGLKTIGLESENYRATYVTPMIFPSSEEILLLSVIDTMKYAWATITALDRGSNQSTRNVNYCPEQDTLAPDVVLTFNGSDLWRIDATELRPWDRSLDTIYFSEEMNVSVEYPGNVQGQSERTVLIHIVDVTKPASFCISASDLAGNFSEDVCAQFEPGLAVRDNAGSQITSIFPNPTDGWVDISMSDATNAVLIVTDVLGREVGRQSIVTSRTSYDIGDLTAGTYYFSVLSKYPMRTIPVMLRK